jgi:hypothetical protein
VSRFSCSPKAITGKAEAKKIYVVGANILSLLIRRVQVRIHRKEEKKVPYDRWTYIFKLQYVAAIAATI